MANWDRYEGLPENYSLAANLAAGAFAGIMVGIRGDGKHI